MAAALGNEGEMKPTDLCGVSRGSPSATGGQASGVGKLRGKGFTVDLL